jgi:hypothetical protein
MSALGEGTMDQPLLWVLVIAAVAGVIAVAAVLERDAPIKESPFGVSTEGEKRCPKCGMGNQVVDARCISCGADLPG